MRNTEGTSQTRGLLKLVAASLIFLAATVGPAAAQQVTGVPGSPSATTTIDGKQIPPPPPKFGGVIKESAKDSTPWWPPRVVPPKGAWSNTDQTSATAGLIGVMLFYDTAVVVVLLSARFAEGMFGMGMWPAVALHSGLAIWCLVCLTSGPRLPRLV